jgi:hypothetical protein
MSENLEALSRNVQLWRSKAVDAYWVRVDYIGSSLHRMGDNTLTYANGKLWHQWHGEWREIKSGSDFWLMSIPGAFSLAREVISEVGDEDASLTLEFNSDYGYIELLRVKMPERDAANFTFETKSFGIEPHPDFKST